MEWSLELELGASDETRCGGTAGGFGLTLGVLSYLIDLRLNAGPVLLRMRRGCNTLNSYNIMRNVLGFYVCI